MAAVEVSAWAGCYDDTWKGLITEASFAHPAKMSLGLLRRIFAHAKEEGWLQPRAIVLDPFAGIGTTALEALLHGCAFQGVELEPRFFALAQANIAQWIHDYRHLPTFGPWAMIVNGDSRELLKHIPAQAGCAIASPPYAGSQQVDNRTSEASAMSSTWRKRLGTITDGETPGQLANMAVSSPPYAGAGEVLGGHNGIDWTKTTGTGQRLTPGRAMQPYGESAGQMCQMAVSSPPYAEGLANAREYRDSTKARTDAERDIMQAKGGKAADMRYGTTPGNLASLSVSSPPYADGCAHTGGRDLHPEHVQGGEVRHVAYGASAGNLGNMVPGGFPCRCAKTAEQPSHEDRAGACPVEASIDASLSPSATDVDVPSVVAPISAASAAPERTAKRSTRSRSRQNIATKSDLPYEGSPLQMPPKISSDEHSFSSPVSVLPIPPTGEAMGSEDYASVSCSETTTDVLDAGLSAQESPSITSKTQQRQGVSGTTVQRICNHCAGFVISSPMQQPSGHALNAAQSLPEPICEAASAPRHAGSNGGIVNSENAENAETFWGASRLVIQQTFQLLRPGGHAIWVLKSYVRDKQIVDFPRQWQEVCHQVGFVTLHIHHAMLVEDHGTQEGLFGEATTYQTERKSFFRRLAEKKGSPRIDYETVLCMVKPAGEGQGIDACVSSPPYSVGLGKEHTYADPAKRENDSHRRIMTEKHIADPYYGDTNGNLGNMSEKGT